MLGRIKKYLLVCLIICASKSFAQIQPITSHYMYNPQIANPAFYGSKDGINLAANFRHQWAKLEGQPQTINIFADAALPQIYGAVGLAITNDRLGAFNNTSLNVGYAFIQDIKKKFKISIGINVGATFSKLDGTKLITPQGNTGDLNDDALSNQLQKSIRPNMAVGIAFIHKYMEAGVVYTNLININDKFKGDITTLKPKYGGVLQTYITSNIKVSKDFSIKPSLVLDFSLMAGYKDFIFLGLNVRGYNKKSFESLSPIVSVNPVKNLKLVYSYDVSLNKLNQVNKGSHEITLNYLLPNNKLYKKPKSVNNPRFL